MCCRVPREKKERGKKTTGKSLGFCKNPKTYIFKRTKKEEERVNNTLKKRDL